MKRLNNRLEKIEEKSLKSENSVGNSLAKIYEWEKSLEGQKELERFYDPNRDYKPNDS